MKKKQHQPKKGVSRERATEASKVVRGDQDTEKFGKEEMPDVPSNREEDLPNEEKME